MRQPFLMAGTYFLPVGCKKTTYLAYTCTLLGFCFYIIPYPKHLSALCAFLSLHDYQNWTDPAILAAYIRWIRDSGACRCPSCDFTNSYSTFLSIPHHLLLVPATLLVLFRPQDRWNVVAERKGRKLLSIVAVVKTKCMRHWMGVSDVTFSSSKSEWLDKVIRTGKDGGQAWATPLLTR